MQLVQAKEEVDMHVAQPEKHEAQITPELGFPTNDVEHAVHEVRLLVGSLHKLQAMLQGSQ